MWMDLKRELEDGGGMILEIDYWGVIRSERRNEMDREERRKG